MQFHNKFNSEYMLYMGMSLLTPPVVRTLESISLMIYLGGYIIKARNHLACYGVYSTIFTVLRQEKLYIFQLLDLLYYIVHVCGNPISTV